MKHFIYNHEHVKEKLAKDVPSMNLPMGFTQDPKILDLTEELQPSYKRISKTTCLNNIMKIKNK